jgi:hypothetical protein
MLSGDLCLRLCSFLQELRLKLAQVFLTLPMRTSPPPSSSYSVRSPYTCNTNCTTSDFRNQNRSPNNISWSVQIMKLIMQTFAASCHSFSLRAFSPEHHVHERPTLAEVVMSEITFTKTTASCQCLHRAARIRHKEETHPQRNNIFVSKRKAVIYLTCLSLTAEVKVTLRLIVSQSVSQCDLVSSPFCLSWPDVCYCLTGTIVTLWDASLTRGRVCRLLVYSI